MSTYLLVTLGHWLAVNVALVVLMLWAVVVVRMAMGKNRNGPVQGEAERDVGAVSAGELAKARAVAQEVSLMALDPIRRN